MINSMAVIPILAVYELTEPLVRLELVFPEAIVHLDITREELTDCVRLA